MTALVVGGFVLVVILAFVWSRVMTARAERRSVENYSHALGVLGDVSRRSDRSASLRASSGTQPGRPHVRTDAEEGAFPTSVSPTGEELLRPGTPSFRLEQPPPARAEVRPTTSIPVPERELRFVDHDTLDTPVTVSPFGAAGPGAAAPGPMPQGGISADGLDRNRAEGGGRPEPEARVPIRTRSPRTQVQSLGSGRLPRPAARRAGVGVAAVLVLGGLAYAGTQLVHSPPPAPRPPPSHHHHATTTTVPASSTTTTPTLITPTSSSSSVVSFTAPTGSYALSFDDSGSAPCWIGVKTTPTSGTWLWMWTLSPGQTETYTAKGAVVVDLGAPSNVSLKLNGVPARLPSYTLPYYLSFSTGPTSGSA